ncbi:syntaxin-2 isoform X1 [Trichomycterus rosablanca]|uniref:syntaxin-2 isoform X1 n=1 Tax=Trichomycterus rosablanca TaxID=2290929 RepID=UPI002F35670C
MRDRLADLKAVSIEEDVIITTPVGHVSFMEDFFRNVKEVREVIDKITSQVNEVKKKHGTILSAPNPDEKTKVELEQLMFEIKKHANMVQTKLKSMQQSMPSEDQTKGGSVSLRIQRTQHAFLSRTFVEVMTEYNETQVAFRERSKTRIQRQMEITGRMTTNEELENMLESGNPSIFTADIISDSQVTREALDEIESRHRDIIRLESSIRELHDIFINMASRVEMQGDTIYSIEKNVRNAADYVIKGKEEIRKAKRYQQSARRKYIILALIVVVIVCVLALIIGLSVGLSSQSTTTSTSSSAAATNPA